MLAVIYRGNPVLVEYGMYSDAPFRRCAQLAVAFEQP